MKQWPIKCPSAKCDFVGVPVKKPRGNWGVLIFLLLLGGIPGIVYMLACSGYHYVCPQCGYLVRSDVVA